MRSRARTLVAGLATAVVLVACGAQSTTDGAVGAESAAPDSAAATDATTPPAPLDPAAGATTAAPAPAPAPQAVPPLLDLVAPAVGGGEVDLRSFAGRPLVLWFWAPG